MARFLATHTISDLTEDELRNKLGAYTGGVSKWRPDRRTTILKVYADTSSGKLFTDAKAVEHLIRRLDEDCGLVPPTR